MQIPQLVQKKFLSHPNEPVTAPLYEIVIAANGVFKRARRFEMTAAIQLEAFDKPLPGLAWETPRVNLVNPIDASILPEILAQARRSTAARDFKENLYAVYWNETAGKWDWAEISQSRSCAATIADDAHPGYKSAILEIHTHPAGCQNFSRQDDRDESGKFRLFGILLDLHSDAPKLRLRCGIYDDFWEFPASRITDLPPEIIDLAQEDHKLLKEAVERMMADENLSKNISFKFVRNVSVKGVEDLCK